MYEKEEEGDRRLSYLVVKHSFHHPKAVMEIPAVGSTRTLALKGADLHNIAIMNMNWPTNEKKLKRFKVYYHLLI
jgi:hypothetical protein